MKQLHKNKWFLIGLILVTFLSSTGSSLIVVAETLDFSESKVKSNEDIGRNDIENTGDAVSSSKNESTLDSFNKIVNDSSKNESTQTQETTDESHTAEENSKEEQLQQSNVDSDNRAAKEIDDRIMQQYWITKFMYGTAVDKNNQYTQFPTTFSNYFKNDLRAKINWSTGGDKLSGNKGSKIQGTFMVPRQFIYTANADNIPLTDTIYAGAAWSGVPDKNEYQFRIGDFEKNSNDFRVTISEQSPYQMKRPLGTSGKYEGMLADFQTFSITIERIRDATHTEDINNGFWIDLDWIFNPRFYYSTWYIDMWYREFKQTMNQAIRVDFQDLKMDEKLTVETKEGTVPLGTTGNLINPQEFVKTVRLGERELSSDEYTVELTNKPYTSKIGKYDCKIKVTLRDSPDKEVESDVKANIVWGSSIVSKARSSGAIDSSVSLLDNNGVPYLKATEGNGFSRQGHLLSRPRFDVYRETQGNKIFSVTNETVKNSPQKLMNIWNGYFSNAEFKYGDVMSYTVYNYGAASSNENGKNTWVSRNNSLTRETQGYRDALYEFTENGLRLMQINQLKITNGNRVPLNTTKEEMNQNIDKYISIPTHIKNPEDYRMEFESIDTTTSGNKTSKINVYQQLQSGGEFKMSYSVNYTVNPTIEETSYDAKGNAISDVKKTTFDFGKEYRPNPEKYINKDDELYVYQGWLEYPMTPGKDTPNQGVPNATKVERKLYYIYEKADKYINVTIPTEIVFGTFDDTEEVKSNKYEIKNNSKELTTNVSLESFQGSSTSVKLLGENEDPDETKDSARLNLLINDESKIKGLNEAKFNISLADLEPENTATMGINGEYYARTSQIHIVEYNTKLKFKAVSGK